MKNAECKMQNAMGASGWRSLLFLGVLVGSLAGSAGAEDWMHWRGPSRDDNVAEASGWNGDAWPLKELWRTRLGEGSASPLVVDGRLYTLSWSDNRDTLWCLDALTGKPVWKQSYPSPRFGRLSLGDKGLYSGPSSTPEYDPATGLIYTLGTDGDLRCWDTRKEGRPVWNLNLYEKYEVPVRPRVRRSGHRDYGFTSSPLALDDQLIVEVGARQGTLISFDKRTGRQLWASAANSPAGHNGGPVPITVDQVPCVAVHNFDGLLVTRIDPGHAGQTVAEHPWRTDFANNIATLAVRQNNVILTSSYNIHRIARFEISLSQGARQVWQLEEASKVCSPVIHGDHVYWAWRQIHCVDFETGRQIWKGGRLGDPGSLIATSDHRLIAWVSNGDLLLIDAAEHSPDAYRQLASREGVTRADAWPHVVLANGRLFCKDRMGELVCFEVEE